MNSEDQGEISEELEEIVTADEPRMSNIKRTAFSRHLMSLRLAQRRAHHCFVPNFLFGVREGRTSILDIKGPDLLKNTQKRQALNA